MTDTLATWEKWPVGALVLAAGLNTALWYAGALLPAEARQALPWLVTLAAVASVVAIDGSLIATIAGMRDGRRSWWSVGNIVVTAVFTGLAALSAHRVLPEPAGAFLHGLFAATIVTYALHLAHPRQDVTIALALREQEVTRREQDVAAREQAVAAREQAPIRVEQVETVRVATHELTWLQLERLVKEAVQRKATSLSSLRRLVDGVEGER